MPDQSDAEKLIAEFIEADEAMPRGFCAGHLPYRDGDGYAYGGEATLCIPGGPTLVIGASERAHKLASGIALHRNKSRRLADGLAIAREALNEDLRHCEERMTYWRQGLHDDMAMEYETRAACLRLALAAIDAACRGEK